MAALVARAFSDGQIAEALADNQRPSAGRLGTIRRKLGLRSGVTLAGWATHNPLWNVAAPPARR